jgi:hypothetical protein
VANTPKTISKSTPRARWAPSVSDVTFARATAVALWILILLAAIGGISALLRPSSSGSDDGAAAAATDDQSQARLVAAGFAERYIITYLQAGSDGESLGPFLGYTPELPGTAGAGAVTAPVRTVDVAEAGDGYWAVTVGVGFPDGESFWRAGVEVDPDTFAAVAVGLPAVVAAPPAAEREPLAVTMAAPPADDPLVETVTGFLSAYLCGEGDLSLYLRPGTALTAVEPAPCDQVQIVRWGAITDDENSQTVVVDAQMDTGANARMATYSAVMTRRDGRWEIAELLPAPPRDSDKD